MNISSCCLAQRSDKWSISRSSKKAWKCKMEGRCLIHGNNGFSLHKDEVNDSSWHTCISDGQQPDFTTKRFLHRKVFQKKSWEKQTIHPNFLSGRVCFLSENSVSAMGPSEFFARCGQDTRTGFQNSVWTEKQSPTLQKNALQLILKRDHLSLSPPPSSLNKAST